MLQVRFASLDALRTLGFLLVFLFHFAGAFGPQFPSGSRPRAICDIFTLWGSVGTNTFFTLSAFFLYRSLRSGSPWIKTLGRRIAHIYPGFVLVLALYLLLAPLGPGRAKFPQHPGEAFLYIVANFLLLPGMTPITPIVTVSWSLSYLVFGYLAIPAIYHGFGMSRLGCRARVGVWSAIAAAVLAWSNHERLIFFIAGILTAELPAITRPVGRWTWTAMALGALLISREGSLSLNALGMMALVWGALSCAPLNTALASLPLQSLASISYPFFLVHGIALQFLRAVWPAELSGLPDLLMIASAAVALSFIFASAMNAALETGDSNPFPQLTPPRPAMPSAS